MLILFDKLITFDKQKAPADSHIKQGLFTTQESIMNQNRDFNKVVYQRLHAKDFAQPKHNLLTRLFTIFGVAK